MATATLGLLLASGCSNTTADDGAGGATPPGPAQPSDPPPGDPPPGDPPTERPSMTAAECQGQSGSVVGDIGNGAIHRPDYLCDNGKPPIGTIVPTEGEPIASEGAVCCPTGG